MSIVYPIVQRAGSGLGTGRHYTSSHGARCSGGVSRKAAWVRGFCDVPYELQGNSEKDQGAPAHHSLTATQ